MDLVDLGLRHQASKFLPTQPPPVTPLQALEHPAPVTVLVCKVKRVRFQEPRLSLPSGAGVDVQIIAE